MAEEKGLASQIKLPELLAALIGGGLLTPLGAFGYAHFAHREAPKWIGEVVPALATSLGAGMVLVAARALQYYRTRDARITPNAKGDRVAVYVASFGGDKASVDAREDVFASIRSNFSAEYVEVLPAGVRYKLSEGVSEEESALRATAAARALLSAKGGHLLIWGSVRKLDGKTRIELRFVTADQSSTPGERKVYGLTDTLVLDPAFGPEMGAALAAVIASSTGPVFETIGSYQQKVIAPLLARLKPFADNPPASMRSSDRAQLLHSYGTMQLLLGDLESDQARLKSSMHTFENVLACLPRTDSPWLWASTQNNLGNAVRILGSLEYDGNHESGLARFRKAIDCFNAALLEWTFDAYPYDWTSAQNNLGNALGNLGEKTDDMDLLQKAAAAHREALRVRSKETTPLDWASSQANLGDIERMMAAIEKDTPARIRLLREAERATRNALPIYTPETYPFYSAFVEYNIGVILADLAELDPNDQRLTEARSALQKAYELFSATSAYEAGRTQVQIKRVDRLMAQP